ncbi:MAG: vWA domain-containing protein [Thiogranum sp.]|nr:vWA domain-containing protein [Thiogranum sp.]
MIRQFPLSSSISRTVFSCLCFLGLAAFGDIAPASAAQDKVPGVDAVLIMDSSGSMAKNDPKELRIPAAKLFMSLLGTGDRVGLISFSDQGYPVLRLTMATGNTNNRMLSAADKVSSKGVYTNLHAGLEQGIAMLEREGQPHQQKMLVLMSDGKMDVGDSDEELDLTTRLRDELLADARRKGIKVFTIAFTESSDVELLKEIARRTDALFKLARTDSDLHEVFSAIFESAKQPDMLPIEDNSFVIDATIEEVTIVASKEREDVRIYLEDPNGNTLSSDDASEKLRWFLGQNFDMITIPDPAPGKWNLVSTDGRNRAYIVTDMTLDHGELKTNIAIDEDLTLEAWLEQDGEILDREAVLTNSMFEMEIIEPNGAKARFELFDQGEFGDRKTADSIYTNTLSYVNPGPYKLNLIVTSATFQRQKSLHFQVEAPDGAEPLPVPESVSPIAAEPVAEPEPEPELQDAEPEAEPEAEAEAPTVQPKEEGVNLVLAMGLFVGVNAVFGAIGFGVWWFIRRRRKAAAAAAADEETEE